MTAESPLLRTLLDALRTRTQITLMLTESLGKRYGLTDLLDSVVFLDADLTDGEMHATLVHELQHLICPECPDHQIEEQTAQMLVPLWDALSAQATGDLAATAARLRVDEQLIRARLRAPDATPRAAG